MPKNSTLTPYCTRVAVAVKALPLPIALPLTLLLKLSTSLSWTSLSLLLLLNQVFLPPRFQAFTGLNNVLRQDIPLWCEELFRAAEHSLAFSRHCRAGQGIGSVSKGRGVTNLRPCLAAARSIVKEEQRDRMRAKRYALTR